VISKISKIYSADIEGINSRIIEVEVDINIGLSAFTIVGLGDKAVSEAKERVSSALKNSGIKPPTRENRKITVNLAPADIKKVGSHYDVAIALGYLAASGQIKPFLSDKKIFVGELALDGKIRPVAGILNVCCMAKEKGFEEIYIPESNSAEVAHISGIKIYPVSSFGQIINHLESTGKINPLIYKPFNPESPRNSVDISEIRGQYAAKRALAIAAAGGHNIFMSGPPGAGKTMLAQALVSILPRLEFQEALEATQIYSAAGLLLDKPFISQRPFRSPHHSASLVSIVGGGQNPKPGEISLAHRGVLFLDELPEFHRDVLESLRQPLESGQVVVSRSRGSIVFPSKFILAAASNPCPCGYYQDEEKECTCSAYEVVKYQKKLSGPLLDRIDIHIWVNRIKSDDLKRPVDENESEKIRRQIETARSIQKERFLKLNLPIFSNAEMSSSQAEKIIQISSRARQIAEKALDRAHVSARGYYKILKVAQTIADLDNVGIVDENALSEAFSYRTRVN
jgi:magnesium chelatase family protein